MWLTPGSTEFIPQHPCMGVPLDTHDFDFDFRETNQVTLTQHYTVKIMVSKRVSREGVFFPVLIKCNEVHSCKGPIGSLYRSFWNGHGQQLINKHLTCHYDQ